MNEQDRVNPNAIENHRLWATPVSIIQSSLPDSVLLNLAELAKREAFISTEQSHQFNFRLPRENFFSAHGRLQAQGQLQAQRCSQAQEHLATDDRLRLARQLNELLMGIAEAGQYYLRENFPKTQAPLEHWELDSFAVHLHEFGKWSAPHAHDRCHFVVDFCLSICSSNSNSGALNLHDPRGSTVSWMNRTEMKVFSIPRRSGQIVIFPSYLLHSIAPMLTEGDQIVSVITNVYWEEGRSNWSMSRFADLKRELE